jgi:predicted metalloprotease with PDZ domain
MPSKKNPEAEAAKPARTRRATAAPPEPTPAPKRDRTLLWAVTFLAAAAVFTAGYLIGHAVGEDSENEFPYGLEHRGGVVVMGDSHCCRYGHVLPGMPMPPIEIYPPFAGEEEIVIDGDGYLGVFLRDTPEAVQVVEVVPDSPADEAGIAVGDRIVAFDRIEITSKEQFADLVAGTEPGTKVELVIGGPGGGRIVEVTIGSRG